LRSRHLGRANSGLAEHALIQAERSRSHTATQGQWIPDLVSWGFPDRAPGCASLRLRQTLRVWRRLRSEPTSQEGPGVLQRVPPSVAPGVSRLKYNGPGTCQGQGGVCKPRGKKLQRLVHRTRRQNSRRKQGPPPPPQKTPPQKNPRPAARSFVRRVTAISRQVMGPPHPRAATRQWMVTDTDGPAEPGRAHRKLVQAALPRKGG